MNNEVFLFAVSQVVVGWLAFTFLVGVGVYSVYRCITDQGWNSHSHSHCHSFHSHSHSHTPSFWTFDDLVQKWGRLRDKFWTKKRKQQKAMSKSPRMLLDELKSALAQTVRERDRSSKPDKAFWSSFTLVCESEELGVVILREDSNNFAYQQRVGNYNDSNWWENVVVGTREGYCFLGRINQRVDPHYGGKEDFSVRVDGDDLIVTTKHAERRVKKGDLSATYSFPFALPQEMSTVSYSYFDGSSLVVIDDDRRQEGILQRHADDLYRREAVKLDTTIWNLPPNWSDTVEKAIQYLPCPDCTVKLVLVDGNFAGDGPGFNAGRLIPVLRERYPDAILFANSGVDLNHANYNPDLLKAGCDYALPDEDYQWKSNLPRILERIAFLRPEIKSLKQWDLNKVLGI